MKIRVQRKKEKEHIERSNNRANINSNIGKVKIVEKKAANVQKKGITKKKLKQKQNKNDEINRKLYTFAYCISRIFHIYTRAEPWN